MTSLCDAVLVYGALCSDHPSLFPYQERFLRDHERAFAIYRRPEIRGRKGVVIVDDYEKPPVKTPSRLLASLMTRIS